MDMPNELRGQPPARSQAEQTGRDLPEPPAPVQADPSPHVQSEPPAQPEAAPTVEEHAGIEPSQPAPTWPGMALLGLALALAAPAAWAVTVMGRGGVSESMGGEPGRDAARYLLGCCSLPAAAAGALLLAARHWGGPDEPSDASANPE